MHHLLGLTWRPVFLLNVPIGAILFLAGLRTLPNGRGEPGRTLDLAGEAAHASERVAAPAATWVAAKAGRSPEDALSVAKEVG